MRLSALFVALSVLVVAGCQSGSDTSSSSAATTSGATASNATAPTGASYAPVQAVFTDNCVECHGADSPKAGLSLTSYDTVMKGSRGGPVVTAGDPDGSKIVQVLDAGHKPHMPPKGQLDAGKVDAIKAWIKAGAKNN